MSTYTIDTATSRATPTPAPGKRLTAPAILARKGGEPIVCLTAYTMRMAQLLDRDGYDIVCGWRKDRKDTFVNRRLPSIIANWIISKATGVALHDYGCSLKVFRSEVVKSLRLYGEMHRFLPALFQAYGHPLLCKTVSHRARLRGQSKYTNFGRALVGIGDMLGVIWLRRRTTLPHKVTES